MRGARIAALALTLALVCLLVARILTVDPPRHPRNTILDEATGAPPSVPPPPPLPESKTAQPAKSHVAHTRIASATPAVAPPVAAAQAPSPAAPDSKAVIWRGNDPADYADDSSATPAVAEAASAEQPKGPVIVRPPERKEDSRGARLVKAVGHALGIGKPDPAEEAFR